MTGPTIAVLLQKLEEIVNTTKRMETKIDTFDGRVQALEQNSAKDCANQEAVKNMVTDHENRLRELEKLIPATRAFIWVAAVFGASAIALIWSVIIGQATIIFK